MVRLVGIGPIHKQGLPGKGITLSDSLIQSLIIRQTDTTVPFEPGAFRAQCEVQSNQTQPATVSTVLQNILTHECFYMNY